MVKHVFFHSNIRFVLQQEFNVYGRTCDQGSVYTSCTNITDEDGREWCATKTDENGAYIEFSKNYGYCSDECLNNPSGLFGTRRVGGERCGDGEICVSSDECAEYQSKKEQIPILKRTNFNAFKDLIQELKSKICNKRKQKICCHCPCVKDKECPYVMELRENTRGNLEKLRSLVCDRAERTFYCCGIEQTEDDGDDDIEDPGDKDEMDPGFLPSAGALFKFNSYVMVMMYMIEKNECGYQSSELNGLSQIIGGEETKIGEYPYAVLLGYHADDNKVILIRCTEI